MLVIDESVADRPDLQVAYFDGSLKLLRELAVTIDPDTALPRLSAIVSKMLPHDALRIARFGQRGQLVVNTSIADVSDITTSDGERVIIDDLRTRALGTSAAPHVAERLVGTDYRSVLGTSTRAPEPLGRVAFRSKQRLAFNRSQAPLARRIAYMAHNRVAGPVVAAAFAILFFCLGSYLGARPSADPQQALAALRAEIDVLRKQQGLAPTRTAGISPLPPAVEAPVFDHEKRAAIVADVKRQLQTEMGLLPLTMIRNRRHSFVELYSYDDRGASSYGTAGYLGNGHFITVKHAVVALGQEGASDPRVINSIKLMINGRPVSARVVDAGDARDEVDPGDWAILKVNEDIDLPALNVGLNYQFEFADPIFRLGNDYSKGIVVSTGYVGQRTPNQLVTCLTDGHPGASGGGVLNAAGRLVGIPIGRMQGDFRFSFILPLRDEMFQKVKLGGAATTVVPSRSARAESAHRRP